MSSRRGVVVVKPRTATTSSAAETSVATSAQSSSASSTSNAGTIAGCVVGGVVFFVLVALAMLLYLRARKRKRTPPSSEFMNSLRAGAAPVFRLDSGTEYTPTLPEKGAVYTHYSSPVALPFVQNACRASLPMQNMVFTDEMVAMTDVWPRSSVEEPFRTQRFSSRPRQVNGSSVSQHHPSASVGSGRELWESETELVSGELSPVRQTSPHAGSVLHFAPRLSLNDPSL